MTDHATGTDQVSMLMLPKLKMFPYLNISGYGSLDYIDVQGGHFRSYWPIAMT
jgi:hypothetical protein